jgi:NAD(P)-dependent dehydrogenase (short-subunit alcohol dehydrogenase family)
VSAHYVIVGILTGSGTSVTLHVARQLVRAGAEAILSRRVAREVEELTGPFGDDGPRFSAGKRDTR